MPWILPFFSTCLIIFMLFAARASGEQCEHHPEKLLPPDNVTVPNAVNTSITIQWQYSPEDVCNTTLNTMFQIKYWLVNRMDSPMYVNASGTVSILDEDNRTYIRHDLDGLEPRQYYSVQLRSICNEPAVCDIIENSNWTQTLTHGAVDGVPDKPTNLTSTEIHEHNTTLMWDEPVNPNGDVMQYEVNYKRHLNSEKGPQNVYFELRSNGTSVTITELESNTTYEFQVAAQTRLGVGLSAQLPVTTKTKINDKTSNLLLVGIISIACTILGISVGLTYFVVRRKSPSVNSEGKSVDVAKYGTYNASNNNATSSTFGWTINLEQLEFNSILSVSKHSGYEVSKGEFKNKRRMRQHKTTVAIKTCYVGANEDMRTRLENESKTLQLIGDHVNVVQLVGTCEYEGTFYEVLEYLPCGTLHSFLRESSRNLRNAKETLLGIAIGIAQGMDFIAKQQVVHRDLATENILMGFNMVVKISGFGFAARPSIAPIQNDVSVLTNWRPKSLESLRHGIHTIESDVWSFGVILWEIAFPGKTPYNARPFHKVKQLLIDGTRLPPPKNWHNGIYEVMLQCWLKEPSERPLFHKLIHTLHDIQKKKQFYPNLTVENNLTDSSLDLDDYDLITSSEPDESSTATQHV